MINLLSSLSKTVHASLAIAILLFLLSKNSHYINGQNIVIDDGWSLWSSIIFMEIILLCKAII